jgi:hypothetical protein
VGALLSLGAATSSAAPTVDGREWRELYQTTGLSWSQVASVCPTDGATPCSGTVAGQNLTGWTWATAGQVRDLLDDYAPGLATADPPVVTGIDGFWGAISFLAVMRWTQYSSSTYSYFEWTAGWTASQEAASGLPIAGSAWYSHQLAGTTANGGVGLGPDTDTASPVRGVFLWRSADGDYTTPVVTPTVSGTMGSNGWYRSNVAVSWTVTDNESPITARNGCDPSTVSVDTGGAAFTCTATSVGGAGSGSVTVKRDTAPPTVTCEAAPTFDMGQVAKVTAVVSDSLSGPLSASVNNLVSTAVAGEFSTVLTALDQAGNSGSRSCGYSVVVPKCQGKTPTIVGTGGNDVIKGTARADVVQALNGADKVDGLGGGDKLCGGDGPDDINGGAGADTLDGGAGLDSIRGDNGSDRCTGGEVRMSSCEVLF